MPPAFAPSTLNDLRAALMASAASAAFFGASPAFAQPEDALLAQTPATRLTVPLRYDGAYRGDVPVAIDGDRVAVWTNQLVDLLGPRLSFEMRDRIFAAATTPVAIDLDALNRLGIIASFNQETLELNISIPLDIQGAQQVSGAALIDRDERDFLRPSAFAASATVLVTQRRVWQSPTEAAGFKPVQVSADLAANIGGAKGVFLFSQHTYDGQSRRLQRGNSQLVFDLAGPAIRTILGDVASLPVGFQSSPLVGGVQVQRAWNELQPLRNIRPSGQTAFVLDRPSTVDVVVNGAVVRSLQLQPGRYDLNDLPFINGLNEVELYVQDDQGRRLLTAFSQFYNVSLLAKGLLDFNVVAGVTQDLSGTGARYRSSNAAMSGWVRYGATENLTIGANLQASRQMVMGGIEGVVATGLGAFSAVASFSRATINGVSGRQGRAFLIGYDGQFGKVGPFRGLRITGDWRRTSRDFVQLGQTQESTVKSLFQARAITQIGDSMSGGLSYVNSIGYDGTPNRRQYSAQLRRNWGRFNLTASYDRQLVSGLPRENRFLLTANMRLGRTQDLRATYDSRTEASRIDYSRFARDEVGALGLRAGLERTPQSVTATGQALYNTNDFRLTLDHRVFRTTEGTPGTGQESVYTVSTQVAMAGGKVAYGRPVGPRFAIVSAHPTLKDARLRLTDGSIRKNPLAKARKGRPALVQLGAPYLTSRVRVDVDRLPAGYDIGPGEYRMKPTPAAGYGITVGSDASRMIMGVALDAAGQPLAQMAGTLISLDDPNAPPVLVFTNRNGRFVVSGLKPGRYELRMGNDGAWRIPVVVPKDDETTIALGTLRLAPRKASR